MSLVIRHMSVFSGSLCGHTLDHQTCLSDELFLRFFNKILSCDSVEDSAVLFSVSGNYLIICLSFPSVPSVLMDMLVGHNGIPVWFSVS